ncbi:MAG: hypothetical protein ACRDKB_00760 [Actinomycetota bacterium]
MVDQPPPQGAPFAFDNAAKALDEQLGRIEALDAKAGVLLAADGVLAGLLFATDSVLIQVPRVLGVAVAISLLFSILLALLAFSTRKYETAPTPEAVIGLMAQGGDAWLKWRFLGNLVLALTINRSKLERKARLLSSAIAFLFIVVLLLGGYLTYVLTAGVGG